MGSDDEDLEFLRLAALKSRKRKLENCNTAGSVTTLQNNSYKKYDGNNKNFKRNKTIKGHRVGRGGINRNNNSNPRVNTNLIAIPIAADSTSNPVPTESKIDTTSDSKEENSKFNRYDHSDHSESESETNVKSNSSDNESVKDRSERGDSLDRLMDELENEIAGNEKLLDNPQTEPKVKDKTKTAKPVKKLDNKSTTDKTEKTSPKKLPNADNIKSKVKKTEEDQLKTEIIDKKPLEKKVIEDKSIDDKIPNDSLPEDKMLKVEDFKDIKRRSPPPRLSPLPHKSPPPRKSPPPIKMSPLRKASPLRRTSPLRRASPIRKTSPPRNLYRPKSPLYRQGPPPKRPALPLSPLRIDTEVLNTITMAPLSPRSAAFVLQNREILAKRKLSPCRRSISSSSSTSSSSPYRSPPRKRSISPYSRPRFAYSPPRRYSPPPRRRSISPQRSDLRRRSRTPPSNDRNYKRRSFSPRPFVRSPSPSRRIIKKRSNSPKGGKISSPSNKSNVYNRLGYKVSKPLPKYEKKPPLRNDSPKNNSSEKTSAPVEPKEASPKTFTDPVLEARRRKFESNKPIEVPGDGVIKIKLNKSPIEKENEIENINGNEVVSETEDLLEEENSNTGLADLWSTDESDNENEGRFKTQSSNTNAVNPIKTVNSRTVSLEKLGPLNNKSRDKTSDTRRRHIESRKRKIHKSSTNDIVHKKIIVKDSSTKEKLNSRIVEQSDSKKSSDTTITTVPTTTVDLKSTNNMRIVISDKPTKNVKENRKVTEVITPSSSPPQSTQKPSSKVIKNVKEESNDSFEPEIVYENENDEANTTETTQNDDLRAELSRRRAERKTLSTQSHHHHHNHGSLKSGPPTRLLRNAFQEMSKKSLTSLSAFQKSSKGLKKERVGKLPIHMRLGKTCKTEDEPLASRSRQNKSDEDDDENDSDEFSQSCNELKSIIKNKSSTSRLQRAEVPYKGRKKRMFGLQV